MSIKLSDKVYRNTQEQVLKNAEDIEEIKAGTILIPDGAVTAPKIAGNAVTTDKLALNAVSTEKIQDEAITSDKISPLAVNTGKIANESITNEKLADESVNTDKIINESVTYQKLDVELRQEVNFGISERLKTINLWDEQWRTGTFDGSGNYTYYATRICSKNLIPVKPETDYRNSSNTILYVYYYDNTGAFISEGSSWLAGGTTTTPSNCYYINISTTDAYGGTYNNNIMINEGPVMPYQPYAGPILHKVDIEPILLWENATPNTTFAGQQVTIEYSDKFDYIIIEYKLNSSSENGKQYIKIKNHINTTSYISIVYEGSTFFDRNFKINSNTQITFSNGYVNGSATNDSIIPTAIYGTNVL